MSQLLNSWPCSLVLNARSSKGSAWTSSQNEILNDENLLRAKSVICSWPEYHVSPMEKLPEIAKYANVQDIFYKNEGERFGIKTFKILGGAYAVVKYLCGAATENRFSIADFERMSSRAKTLCAQSTFVSATDGNHGRSVAWGARKVGSSCVIVLPSEVSFGRYSSLIELGAEVITNPGTFDDCVRQAAKLANEQGWVVISDTSYPNCGTIPIDVMQGYEIACEEAIQQLAKPPTHVFVQAGVGGLAAAVSAYLKRRFGSKRPTIVLAEPETAGCCYESFKQGKPAVVDGSLRTQMGGLACGEVSLFAWEILKDHVDAALKLPDNNVVRTMKLLAASSPKIVAGESGVAGLVGVISSALDPRMRKTLGIDANSKILVFGTEADSDPDLYQKLIR